MSLVSFSDVFQLVSMRHQFRPFFLKMSIFQKNQDEKCQVFDYLKRGCSSMICINFFSINIQTVTELSVSE